MTHPFENFEQENISFANSVLSGKIKTKVVFCAKCKNLFLIELNTLSVEFEPQYCPYCKHTGSTSSPQINPDDPADLANSVSNHIATSLMDVPDQTKDVFADKYYRVLTNPQMQKFNIIACKNCHNRTCVLEEDRMNVKFCAFCANDKESLVCLIDTNTDINQGLDSDGTVLSYVGRLFHIKTKKFEDNLILTDMDLASMRYRFIKVDASEVALWISDSDILEMYEFINLPADIQKEK